MDGIARRTCAALLLALAAALCAAAPALATDGKVTGKKWHDLNANGVKDAGEPVVKDWWIYLDTNRDGDHDSGEPAAKTDASGNYSISGIRWWVSNHQPRTYDVREEPVANQPQDLDRCSYPAGCKYTLTFSNGSHIYGGKDFGNYKRGKIVVKKVNVGGTQTDAFDFTSAKLGDFSLAASDAAGKAFASLEPGTYGVAEQARAGYVQTGAACDDGSDPSAIKLSSGETVTCTFTNTRTTGRIKVVKQLLPSSDSGTFDLAVDGATVASGGDGATATVTVPTGSGHSVAESGATLADYTSAVSCTDGSSGTTSASGITVKAGETVVCTFTNTRKATVTVTKTEGGATDLSRDWSFVLRGGPEQVELARSTAAGHPIDFGQLLPGAYTLCEVDLPAGWISSLGPAVNGTVCVDLTLAPGEADTVAVDNIRPQIELLKQVRRGGDAAWAKEATLQVGQTAEYLLTVTNPGVGPLVDLVVVDDRCDAAPVYAGGDADADGELDETEAWTYRCDHVVTAADGARYVNTAEANAADKRGNPVRDTDTATVDVTAPQQPPQPPLPPTSRPDEQQVLPAEIVSGTARLRGPSGCTRRPFAARVTGRQIARVTFWLDGKQVKRIVAKGGQTAFALKVNPRKVGRGVHRVSARVVFAAGSRTAPRTLRLSFQRCARQVVTPQFTG